MSRMLLQIRSRCLRDLRSGALHVRVQPFYWRVSVDVSFRPLGEQNSTAACDGVGGPSLSSPHAVIVERSYLRATCPTIRTLRDRRGQREREPGYEIGWNIDHSYCPVSPPGDMGLSANSSRTRQNAPCLRASKGSPYSTTAAPVHSSYVRGASLTTRRSCCGCPRFSELGRAHGVSVR